MSSDSPQGGELGRLVEVREQVIPVRGSRRARPHVRRQKTNSEYSAGLWTPGMLPVASRLGGVKMPKRLSMKEAAAYWEWNGRPEYRTGTPEYRHRESVLRFRDSGRRIPRGDWQPRDRRGRFVKMRLSEE